MPACGYGRTISAFACVPRLFRLVLELPDSVPQYLPKLYGAGNILFVILVRLVRAVFGASFQVNKQTNKYKLAFCL